jgi:hypothetical protein
MSQALPLAGIKALARDRKHVAGRAALDREIGAKRVQCGGDCAVAGFGAAA